MKHIVLLLGGIVVTSGAFAVEQPSFGYGFVYKERSGAYAEINSESEQYASDLFTTSENHYFDSSYIEYPFVDRPAAWDLLGSNRISFGDTYHEHYDYATHGPVNKLGVYGDSYLLLSTESSALNLSAKTFYYGEIWAHLDQDAIVKFEAEFFDLTVPQGANSYYDIQALIDDVKMPLSQNGDLISGELVVPADLHSFTILVTLYGELDTPPTDPVGYEALAGSYSLLFSTAPVPSPATGPAILIMSGCLAFFRRRS